MLSVAKAEWWISLNVEGIHCEHCKNREEEAVNDIQGVAGKVNLKHCLWLFPMKRTFPAKPSGRGSSGQAIMWFRQLQRRRIQWREIISAWNRTVFMGPMGKRQDETLFLQHWKHMPFNTYSWILYARSLQLLSIEYHRDHRNSCIRDALFIFIKRRKSIWGLLVDFSHIGLSRLSWHDLHIPLIWCFILIKGETLMCSKANTNHRNTLRQVSYYGQFSHSRVVLPKSTIVGAYLLKRQTYCHEKSALDWKQKGLTGKVPIRPNDAIFSISCNQRKNIAKYPCLLAFCSSKKRKKNHPCLISKHG